MAVARAPQPCASKHRVVSCRQGGRLWELGDEGTFPGKEPHLAAGCCQGGRLGGVAEQRQVRRFELMIHHEAPDALDVLLVHWPQAVPPSLPPPSPCQPASMVANPQNPDPSAPHRRSSFAAQVNEKPARGSRGGNRNSGAASAAGAALKAAVLPPPPELRLDGASVPILPPPM